MSRRLAVALGAVLPIALVAACHYGSDDVVPPPSWWTGDTGGAVDASTKDALADTKDAPAPDAADASDASDAPFDAGETGPCGPVVNEVMMRGVTGDDEFVELLNTCDTPLVFDATWTLTTPTNGGFGQTNVVALDGKTLPAHGYLLFVGNGYAGAAASDGLLSDGTDQLSSSGGAIAIVHENLHVDAVGWGSLTRTDFLEGTVAVQPPANGKSIGRHPNGFDTRQNAVDFATDLAPTPRADNP